MRRSPLIAAFLLAACAAEAETLRLPGPDGTTLRAELRLPPPGVAPRPVVIALHGCAGLPTREGTLRLPPRERDWAARLTAAGHPVLFPDSFGSRDAPEACGRAMDHPAPASTVRRADALAAAAWAATQRWAPPGGVILLGWSHGGSTALAASAGPPPGLVRAAIALYPGCGPLTFPAGRPAPSVPTLILLGDADTWVSPAPCRRIAEAQAGTVRAVTYPGALHGFDLEDVTVRARTLPDGRRVTLGGDPAARAASIAAVRAFLDEHGAGRR